MPLRKSKDFLFLHYRSPRLDERSTGDHPRKGLPQRDYMLAKTFVKRGNPHPKFFTRIKKLLTSLII